MEEISNEELLNNYRMTDLSLEKLDVKEAIKDFVDKMNPEEIRKHG